MNEMKMVAAMTLRRFRLSADPSRKILLQPTIIMRAQYVLSDCASVLGLNLRSGGIWLKFETI